MTVDLVQPSTTHYNPACPNAGEPLTEIFTAASCINNPGHGGWAYTIRRTSANGQTLASATLSCSVADTTNNRMELVALCQALEGCETASAKVYCRAHYVRGNFIANLASWKANGWKTDKGKGIANPDLWQRLDKAASGLAITWAEASSPRQIARCDDACSAAQKAAQQSQQKL
ncbi:RNase H family protein [Pseudoprimorskyibacter insulae]|uniref:Ribonuclease HI n=1 Tax=Pseudoprimorskyibacter insulae TaxID=1695997 RepID=A0A2R8ANI4_9RHOB|nr:RNase H family protein [Pseudoprimorskyibacter insulae]SPF77601.1 Ribonuclease HI [Pseudoprimorskyibacter insulae]